MARSAREWFELLIFLAGVPFMPVTFLLLYSLMERLGF
jgi:hypothetical protein